MSDIDSYSIEDSENKGVTASPVERIVIKPCPFCRAKVSLYWCMCWNKGMVTIKCDGCKQRTRKGWPSEEEAIEAWDKGAL